VNQGAIKQARGRTAKKLLSETKVCPLIRKLLNGTTRAKMIGIFLTKAIIKFALPMYLKMKAL